MELHNAVLRGNLQDIQRIVKSGADVNSRYGDQTYLMVAARSNDLPVVKFLLEEGADLGAVTSDHGNNALLVAIWYHDETEVPHYLLDQGVAVEFTNDRGHTALHCAAHCGRIKALLLLMSYGANLYAQDNRGRLPIDLAKTEEIKQAILDEEARRDHRFKRIPEADLLPAPPAEASDVSDAKEEEGEEEEEEESSSDEDES